MLKKVRITLILTAAFLMAGCSATIGSKNPNTAEKEAEAVEQKSWSEDFDSQDTGVLVKVDTKRKTATIKRVDSGDKLELKYSGATDVKDQYESILTMEQVQLGELVNINYKSKDSTLRGIQVSPDAWEYTDVQNLAYDRTEKIMTISGEKFKYGASFTVMSEDSEIDILDLNPIDTVTVKGYNKKVCSVIVTKGHGYIKLKNADYFYDGWIDVGQESAKPITKDMLVVASEGNHKVTVSKDGVGGTRSITVKRNEETVMDVGDLKGEAIKSGSLKFTISPKGATLYIDNVKKDYSELVVVDYGTHKIRVKADNYEDYTQTVVVGSSYAEIEINMDDVSYGSVEFSVTPKTAALYVDGEKKSLSEPVTLKYGKHTIKVSASGYEDYNKTITVSKNYEEIKIEMTKTTNNTTNTNSGLNTNNGLNSGTGLNNSTDGTLKKDNENKDTDTGTESSIENKSDDINNKYDELNDICNTE